MPLSDPVLVALVTAVAGLLAAMVTSLTLIATNIVLFLLAEKSRRDAHEQTRNEMQIVKTAVDQNTQLTNVGAQAAQVAYQEANHVNEKIVDLSQTVREIAKKIGTGPIGKVS